MTHSPPLPSNSFSTVDEWFERMFGFQESTTSVAENLSFEIRDGENYITSKVNGRSYLAGNFAVRHLSSFNPLPDVGNGTFNIMIGTGRLGPTDVMNIEANPEYDGCTIQVASNFNCLDHIPRPRYKPPNGTCSQYITEMVQGPPADVAAAPGLLYRVYFLPMKSGKVGQLEEDLNLIETTPITVRDGYTIEMSHDFDYKNAEHYPVGVHQNIAVTLARDGEQIRLIEGQTCHQVFCSAVSFNHPNIQMSAQNYEVAAKIIETEYMETILAAWENSVKYPDRPGSKKLFLTFIGGGVFVNPAASIIKAIMACEETIKRSGLEVYATCFDRGVYANFAPLNELVTNTHGRVIDLNKHNFDPTDFT